VVLGEKIGAVQTCLGPKPTAGSDSPETEKNRRGVPQLFNSKTQKQKNRLDEWGGRARECALNGREKKASAGTKAEITLVMLT